MKFKFFYILFFSVIFSSCITDKLDDRPITVDIIAPENPPSMKFEADVFKFVLKDWPKKPIMVGEVGEIPIEFTSKKSGFTKKYISILANTKPATTKLYLQGYVSGL